MVAFNELPLGAFFTHLYTNRVNLKTGPTSYMYVDESGELASYESYNENTWTGLTQVDVPEDWPFPDPKPTYKVWALDDLVPGFLYRINGELRIIREDSTSGLRAQGEDGWARVEEDLVDALNGNPNGGYECLYFEVALPSSFGDLQWVASTEYPV